MRNPKRSRASLEAELDPDPALRMARQEKENILGMCMEISDKTTPTEYASWLETTPDDNAGFNAAVRAKLAEIIGNRLTYERLYTEAEREKWEMIWTLAQVEWVAPDPDGSDTSLLGQLNEAGFGSAGPF